MFELSHPALTRGIIGIVAVPVLWLSWRRPTWLLVFALALLAIRPEILWGGPAVSTDWNVHHTVLTYALVVNALHYGIRRTINWPITALIIIFVASSLFGALHPDLTLGYMLIVLVMLAMPFSFTQVQFESSSRYLVAMTIALTPLLSVAIGVVWEVLGVRPLFPALQWGGTLRLAGATGNAAIFAMLSFAGFAVATHESGRRGNRLFLCLMPANLTLVILSGTRMGMLASGAFLAMYCLMSEHIRARLLRHRGMVIAGGCFVAAIFLVYWPILQSRLFEQGTGNIQMSGRNMIWPLYYHQFELSPIFGRGIGAGFVARTELLRYFPLDAPHNEYLHLLVIGGVFGFVLFIGGVVLWYRSLWNVACSDDRPFLAALAAPLALYAITDNLLVYSSGLALYAYLGALLARRA